jgi:hypothetical protein
MDAAYNRLAELYSRAGDKTLAIQTYDLGLTKHFCLPSKGMGPCDGPSGASD